MLSGPVRCSKVLRTVNGNFRFQKPWRQLKGFKNIGGKFEIQKPQQQLKKSVNIGGKIWASQAYGNPCQSNTEKNILYSYHNTLSPSDTPPPLAIVVFVNSLNRMA